MTTRLFIFVAGDEVAAFTADHIPRVGDVLWFKTLDASDVVVVEGVEHQFDRSKSETYSTHDVSLYCRKK